MTYLNYSIREHLLNFEILCLKQHYALVIIIKQINSLELDN